MVWEAVGVRALRASRCAHESRKCARARFGTYDLIDFVAVLIGYAVSGETTFVDKTFLLSHRAELRQDELLGQGYHFARFFSHD